MASKAGLDFSQSTSACPLRKFVIIVSGENRHSGSLPSNSLPRLLPSGVVAARSLARPTLSAL
jgi:hypothetical protein